MAVSYNGQTYIVNPDLNTANTFRIKSPVDGSFEAVPLDVASHLFAAQSGIALLHRLYDVADVGGSPAYWTNEVNSAEQVLSLVAVNNLLGTTEGLLFTATVSGPEAVAAAPGALLDLLAGQTPATVDLAVVCSLANSATQGLDEAKNLYYATLASSTLTPVDYSSIEFMVNNTIKNLAIGHAASNAAIDIPGVKQSVWDDIHDFFSSMAGAIAQAVTKTDSVFQADPEIKLVGPLSDLTDQIDQIGALQDQNGFLQSLVNGLSGTSDYAPLSAAGLAQIASDLSSAGSPAVIANTSSGLYGLTLGIVTAKESQGSASFTITRGDAGHAATVYVSTVHDLGIDNPNENYYYVGIKNLRIDFAANQTSAVVHIGINDLGLTSGSETFRLIVQNSPNDPITTSLASAKFVIVNDDTAPSHYAISPSAPMISENAGHVTFTITRTEPSQRDTVYVSTVHDQGTDNPNGGYYHQGLLDKPIVFAAGQSTATVDVNINDLGLTSGSETFRLILQHNSTDPISTVLAGTNFTIVNNDSVTQATPGITAIASVTEPTDTTFLLAPFFDLGPGASSSSVALVNFLNLGTGPGQLTFNGTPVSGNLAVAYGNIGEVGFSTGGAAGADKIEIYANYANGTQSNKVDLTVNSGDLPLCTSDASYPEWTGRDTRRATLSCDRWWPDRSDIRRSKCQ